MRELYTSGRWTVKPGREDDFAQAWADLAEWTIDNFEGSQWARLLQSRERPTQFVSFGPWGSEDAIGKWRASSGFQERVGAIQEMLEEFQPGVFELRVHFSRD